MSRENFALNSMVYNFLASTTLLIGDFICLNKFTGSMSGNPLSNQQIVCNIGYNSAANSVLWFGLLAVAYCCTVRSKNSDQQSNQLNARNYALTYFMCFGLSRAACYGMAHAQLQVDYLPILLVGLGNFLLSSLITTVIHKSGCFNWMCTPKTRSVDDNPYVAMADTPNIKKAEKLLRNHSRPTKRHDLDPAK